MLFGQPHTGAAAVFVDERDAGVFKGALESRKVISGRRASAVLEIDNDVS